MNTLNSRIDNLKSQNMLTTLVAILTLSVLLFSTYLSASFWKQLGNTTVACLTFAMLGVFLELAKICAGQAVISSYSLNNRILKIIAITVLLIFTITSFVASVGTIAHELKTAKITAFNADSEVKTIRGRIAAQEQIISNLLQSQQADTLHGYRARAHATLMQIKQAQNDLEILQNKLSKNKIDDATVSNVVVIFNSLISLGQDQWEIVLIVILGALTEITSLFLLYLNSALKNTIQSKKQILSKNVAILKPMVDDLPISKDEYQKITRHIIAGEIIPTQRGLKKVVRLGNENIAKIFMRLVEEGVLVKAGKSYKVAA